MDWNMITQIISIGGAISVGITILTRILPNDKVYMMGWGVGVALTKFGKGKTAGAWESIETFFTESLNYLFCGLKDGMNSDDGNGGLPPNPPKVEKKVRV
jgi:hypothetical protein